MGIEGIIMISIQGMYKSYSSKYTGKQVVFSDFTMNLPQKGFVSILGKSGCGKTTLLNILGAIDRIDQGQVVSFKYDLSKFSNNNKRMDEYRKNIVGFVFQNYNLIHSISVYKNLALPLEMQGYTKVEISNKINQVLQEVDMVEYKERMPYELSGGQQQRIAIARAIIKDAKVLLADEPTGNLDSTTAKEILTFLKEISKSRLVVFVTHEEEYASEYSDQLIKLQDGRIINDYSMKQVSIETQNKKASKLSIRTIFNRSLSHLKTGILKTVLITTLFAVMIGIFTFSITTVRTSKEDILESAIQSRDDFVTNVHGVGLIETNDGLLAFYGGGYGHENLIAVDAYNELIEKYGNNNILLTSHINIMNDFDLDSDLFNSDIDPVILNFLDSSTSYEIPKLEGTVPDTADEIIISDYLAMLVFDTEDVIGEILEINRYEAYSDYTEKELTIVGIIHTNYRVNIVTQDSVKNDYIYSGSTNLTPDPGYQFIERNVYAQAYALSTVFDNLDSVHKNPLNELAGKAINLNIHYGENMAFATGDFYSSDIINLSTVKGSLPIQDNEIAISSNQLETLFSDYSTEISDLLNDNITFTQFKTLLEISNLTISYDDVFFEEMYQGTIPSSFNIVGVYEKRTDGNQFIDNESVVLTTSLISELNAIHPYSYPGISVINSSNLLKDILNDIQESEFINLHNVAWTFDPIVILNRQGALYLYRAIETFEDNILPLMSILLYIAIAFTFVLLFLYSYLSTMTNKKQIGIYRSLGFSNGDVLKMYAIEHGLITIISMIIGFIGGYIVIQNITSMVFENTIYSDIPLISISSQEALIILGLSIGLLLLTSVLPLYKLLRMTPINIINKE